MKTLIHSIAEKTSLPKSSYENNLSFHIICNDRKNPFGSSSFDLSPNDILNLTQNGVKIYASPHIGNHWPSNTFYREMGVIICDFTGNQSMYDICDEPAKIILNGKKHVVAKNKRATLSPYLILSKEKRRVINNFTHLKDLSNLAGIHHKSKKQALGCSNVILDTDFLNFPFFKEIIKTLMEHEVEILKESKKHLFNRYVSKEGFVEKKQFNQDINSIIQEFIELKKQHRKNILEEDRKYISGPLPIVELWIIMDAIYSWLSHKQTLNGVGDSFCVSGVDMVFYLKNPQKRKVLDIMYKIIRDNMPELNLPDQMRFYVLPGGLLNFYPAVQETQLHQEVLNILDIHNQQQILSKKFSCKMNNKNDLINTSKKITQNMRERQVELKKRITERTPYTQYDILSKNLKFCPLVNDQLVNLKFNTMKKLFH